jgi:spore germination protein YaaH
MIMTACAAYAEDPGDFPKGTIREIWAYLMPGEEAGLKGNEPITDLCYFAGELNYRGELVVKGKLSPEVKIPSGARTHLVVADIRNMDLVHFVINPAYPLRAKFMKDISEASKDYAGVQIDFESISRDDRDMFFSFLSDLKKTISPKTLSIAVPARMKRIQDCFSYREVSSIVDRVFIMAYDEHWSGSAPGPVASTDWCDKVADYAVTAVPADRLVMGIPFYGRSWQNKKHDRALRFMTAQDLMKTNNEELKPIEGPDPGFEFEDEVKVTVYYETPKSLMNKARIYKEAGVRGIGFWRVGQEPREIWDLLSKEISEGGK